MIIFAYNSTQWHHEHMLEAILESTEEAMASQVNKNRKRKKGESGKENWKNRNLEIIPELFRDSGFFRLPFPASAFFPFPVFVGGSHGLFCRVIT